MERARFRTDGGLAAVRRAAAMAHTVGAISLRLTGGGGEHIVDVVPDVAQPVDRRRRIDPCGFRLAVARACADDATDLEIARIGLDRPNDVDIAWAVANPGAHLGLGAVRAPCGGRMVWAFASILAPDALASVLGDLDDEAGGAARPTTAGLAAHLVRDELLHVTVVHVEADPPGTSTMRMLDEVLRRIVAAVAATEIVAALAA